MWLTWPGIQFAVLSCFRFKHKYGEAVKYIARYLKGTSNHGITLYPKHDQGFRAHANTDLSGNWLKEYAEFEPTTAKDMIRLFYHIC